MHRILNTSIATAILAMTTSGCRPFYSSIENDTGQRIWLTVKFNNDTLVGHGYLEKGGGLDLFGKITDISAIDYKYDGKSCHIDGSDVPPLVFARKEANLPTVALKKC